MQQKGELFMEMLEQKEGRLIGTGEDFQEWFLVFEGTNRVEAASVRVL